MNAQTKTTTHPGVKADEELSKANLPATTGATAADKAAGTSVEVYDPGDDAGAGMEDIKREEYSIPFMYVLDPKSPACQPPTAGGIAGAKPGMLYNTATQELHDGEAGLPFIPFFRRHYYGEWIPRNADGSGGGFVGIRSDTDPLVLELLAKHGEYKKLPTSDGHELIETYELYGVGVVDGFGSPFVLPVKSTGIPAFKNFITRQMGITYIGKNGNPERPAIFSHLWRLGTQYRPAKKQGQSGWYIPRIILAAPKPIEARLKMTDPLYDQARGLYHSMKAGKISAAKEDVKNQQPTEEEIPF